MLSSHCKGIDFPSQRVLQDLDLKLIDDSHCWTVGGWMISGTYWMCQMWYLRVGRPSGKGKAPYQLDASGLGLSCSARSELPPAVAVDFPFSCFGSQCCLLIHAFSWTSASVLAVGTELPKRDLLLFLSGIVLTLSLVRHGRLLFVLC